MRRCVFFTTRSSENKRQSPNDNNKDACVSAHGGILRGICHASPRVRASVMALWVGAGSTRAERSEPERTRDCERAKGRRVALAER